jgi:hypothetical protein
MELTMALELKTALLDYINNVSHDAGKDSADVIFRAICPPRAIIK